MTIQEKMIKAAKLYESWFLEVSDRKTVKEFTTIGGEARGIKAYFGSFGKGKTYDFEQVSPYFSLKFRGIEVNYNGTYEVHTGQFLSVNFNKWINEVIRLLESKDLDELQDTDYDRYSFFYEVDHPIQPKEEGESQPEPTVLPTGYDQYKLKSEALEGILDKLLGKNNISFNDK